MIQIPASSPWIALARFRKVMALITALDRALLAMQIDPFSPGAHAAVAGLSDLGWQVAARAAGVPPASVETRAAVIDLYAERVARAA